MNNTCPSCGALYNVASKDIGRRIKCKKCSSALIVTEAGLEEEGAASAAPAPAPRSPAPASPAPDYDEEPPIEKKKKRDRPAGPSINPLAMLEKIGGLSTIIFAFGVFLVIVFTSFPVIGSAGTRRANAYVDKLKLEQATEVKNLFPKGKKISDLTSEELKRIEDDTKKINEKYEKQLTDATLDAERTKIGNIRDEWMEMYGLMFGFILVAFGCIGYLRTEQPLTLRIVAAVVLGALLLLMFMKFSGCAVPK
jgi:predicted Zn finger-like uncharacterized protein